MAFQILRPFTLAFTVSQRDGHGMRVNCNIGDLCLSVSPRCIEIIKNTVQVWTLFKNPSLFKISYCGKKFFWALTRRQNKQDPQKDVFRFISDISYVSYYIRLT
jgi:hypothetical protein